MKLIEPEINKFRFGMSYKEIEDICAGCGYHLKHTNYDFYYVDEKLDYYDEKSAIVNFVIHEDTGLSDIEIKNWKKFFNIKEDMTFYNFISKFFEDVLKKKMPKYFKKDMYGRSDIDYTYKSAFIIFYFENESILILRFYKVPFQL